MISIIYEDEDIVAVDKPSGVIVNRADTTKGIETVQDWSERKLHLIKPDDKLPQQCTEDNGKVKEFYDRGGIVHRIDKETSGILLIAKNPGSFAELQSQFKERIVKKTYIALVHGKVIPAEGEINVPVGRLPWNRKQFGVIAGGREAVTKYKTVCVYNYNSSRGGNAPARNMTELMSLLELYPLTGRTHQIRVHLKYLGNPIFADFLYAGRKTQREDRKFLSRVFLHAAKISFRHPKTGEVISLESKLPEELERVLEIVSRQSGQNKPS